MNNIKMKFMHFMQGRYGSDQLSRAILIVAILLAAISFIVRIPAIYYFSIIALIYVYFRMFSRNIPKRYQENQKYLQFENRIRYFIRDKKNSYLRNKGYHIYKCPTCKQKIRVPKGHGKIAIRCSKCQTEFIRRS